MKNHTDIEFTRNRAKHRAKQFYAQKDWYKEYIESGAQYSMTYTQFRAQKRRAAKKTQTR